MLLAWRRFRASGALFGGVIGTPACKDGDAAHLRMAASH